MKTRFLVISTPSGKTKAYFSVNRLLKIHSSDSSPSKAVPTVALAFEGRLGATLYLRDGADPDKIVTELFEKLDQEDQDLVYLRSDDITDVNV